MELELVQELRKALRLAQELRLVQVKESGQAQEWVLRLVQELPKVLELVQPLALVSGPRWVQDSLLELV